jgi:predicted amidohydrolase
VSATLRVAAAQAESAAGDVPTNVATAVALVGTAAAQGARVVVLPELFLTGYAPAAWSVGAALTTEDPRLDPLREAAAGHELVVVAGAAVRRGSGDGPSTPVTLSVLVVGPTGHVTAPYDKQHLFAGERTFFTAGDHGATVVVDGWDLALGICYDGCFPEHAAAAARDGARAYLCPAAYFVGSDHRRDLYYAARALDNGIYVVLSGLVGDCGGQGFSGGSAVYDPEGRVVSRAGDESPAVVVADLQASEVARVQETNPIERDRVTSLGVRTRLALEER